MAVLSASQSAYRMRVLAASSAESDLDLGRMIVSSRHLRSRVFPVPMAQTGSYATPALGRRGIDSGQRACGLPSSTGRLARPRSASSSPTQTMGISHAPADFSFRLPFRPSR